MRQIFLLFACLTVQTLIAQNFQSGFRQISFSDPSRTNRIIPADIYYPAASSGTNVPLASGTQIFPVVVFGHGFLIPTSSYKWLGDTLSRYGFIAVFPSTESSGSPNHNAFGADLSFLAARVTSLNDSSGSPFFGRVKKRAAVGGHSMGGGSSFLSAATGPSVLSALFNFAAAETNPSAQQAATQVNIPALIFSGSADCIVPPSTQKTMYSSIPYPCKTYINITDGLHCHFSANDATCALGQVFSGCNSSSVNSQAIFQKVIAVLMPFLDIYLNENCSSTLFSDRYLSLTGVQKERVCMSDPKGCPTTPVNETNAQSALRVFPNPVQGSEMIQLDGEGTSQIRSYKLFASKGECIQYGDFKGGVTKKISLKGLQPGNYLLVLHLSEMQKIHRWLVVQ